MALATTAPSASSPSSSSSNGFTTSIDVLSHVPFLPTTPSYPSDESSCTTTIVQPLTFFLCTSTLYAATTTAAVDCAGCAIEHVTARPGALKELGGVDAGDEKFVYPFSAHVCGFEATICQVPAG